MTGIRSIASASARIFLILMLSWLMAAFFLILRPTMDRGRRVDAIVVLGPPHAAGAFDAALRMADQGLSSHLLVSASEGGFDYAICKLRIRGVPVECFRAVPATTEGEARYVRSLAERAHWHSIMVVTGEYHVSRARFIFRRCVGGEIIGVGTNRDVSFGSWIYQFLRESGSWLKDFWSSC